MQSRPLLYCSLHRRQICCDILRSFAAHARLPKCILLLIYPPNLSKSSLFFPSAKFTLFFSDQIGSVTSPVKKCWRRKVICSPAHSSGINRGAGSEQQQLDENMIRKPFSAETHCRCNCSVMEGWLSPGWLLTSKTTNNSV